MAHVADHLSIDELEQRYRACEDVCEARHYHAIWLLAQGHTIVEVSELTSFVPRWVEQLQEICAAITARSLPYSPRSCWSSLRSVCASRRRTAACGQAARSPPGWRLNWGSRSLPRSVAGKRCRRSAGRSSRHGRGIPIRLRRNRKKLLKKAH